MKYILILLFAVSVSNSNAQYQSIFGSEKTSWHFYEWSIFAYFKDSIVSDERITHPTYGEWRCTRYIPYGIANTNSFLSINTNNIATKYSYTQTNIYIYT
jgi:hypothetical protein